VDIALKASGNTSELLKIHPVYPSNKHRHKTWKWWKMVRM